MKIRPAVAADVVPLSETLVKTPLLERYGSTPAALQKAFDRGLASDDGFLVATDDDQSAPWGMAWFQRTGVFGPAGYLRLIALAPGHEGQGIGTALLDEVERQVAEVSRVIFLLVSDFNEGAQRFYARRGYQPWGTLAGFVRPDIDEHLYVKKLK